MGETRYVLRMLNRWFSTGIIEAVARDFFNSEITMEVVNEIKEEERTGKKEHIVFLVTQQPAFSKPACSDVLRLRGPSHSMRSHTMFRSMEGNYGAGEQVTLRPTT